jgi:DNA-binding GntR family transcriptional regulator
MSTNQLRDPGSAPPPPPTPQDPPSTKAAVAYARIRHGIGFGEWRTGDRIPIDAIARELGCSHIPVREALSRLAAEGLVVDDPHRGFRMAGLITSDLVDIYGMLGALEPLAARLSAEARTEADVLRLEEVATAMESTVDPAEWVGRNLEFHQLLYAPCGRQRLLRSIENLMTEAARELQRGRLTLDFLPRSNREHRHLIALFRAGDGEELAHAVSAHIRGTEERLIAAAIARA